LLLKSKNTKLRCGHQIWSEASPRVAIFRSKTLRTTLSASSTSARNPRSICVLAFGPRVSSSLSMSTAQMFLTSDLCSLFPKPSSGQRVKAKTLTPTRKCLTKQKSACTHLSKAQEPRVAPGQERTASSLWASVLGRCVALAAPVRRRTAGQCARSVVEREFSPGATARSLGCLAACTGSSSAIDPRSRRSGGG